jgi:hypothetical protein
MRAFLLVIILVGFCTRSANAWWQYAKWGMTEGQILAANQGRVSLCTPDVPACATRTGAPEPKFFVEGLRMLSMPVTVSFAFDESGRLNQTAVVFPDTDFTVVAKILTGINGNPISERSGSSPVATWRDDQRGTTITVTGNGRSSTAVYRPTN